LKHRCCQCSCSQRKGKIPLRWSAAGSQRGALTPALLGKGKLQPLGKPQGAVRSWEVQNCPLSIAERRRLLAMARLPSLLGSRPLPGIRALRGEEGPSVCPSCWVFERENERVSAQTCPVRLSYVCASAGCSFQHTKSGGRSEVSGASSGKNFAP